MKKHSNADTNNDMIYFYILIIFVALGSVSFIHEAVLHSGIAYLNGWNIDSVQSGFMIGSTTATAKLSTISTSSMWLFYMAPALVIILISVLINALKPSRLLRVFSVISVSLQLPSLNPEISGSDSYNAVQFLISRGWTDVQAYGSHYILFFGVIVLWGIFLYAIIENSNKDTTKRFKNVIQ